MIGPTNGKNLLTFGGDHFSTSLSIAEYDISGDLLAFGHFSQNGAK